MHTNGLKKWVIGILITIAVGLGGWNLTATVDNGKKLAAQEIKCEDTRLLFDQYSKYTDKKFDEIMKKLNDIDKYIREIKK